MVRLFCWALIGLVGLSGVVLAEDGKLEVPAAGGAEVHFQSAEYTRELWIGLCPDGIEQGDFLAALREACSDTTSVGVIRCDVDPELTNDPLEREVLASVSTKTAVRRLAERLKIDRRNTRIVLVGMFESSLVALRAGADETVPVDGVVLIDPPVGDIEVEGKRPIGVDVFLHPRSQGEFEREENELVDRLGGWGMNARIIRSPDRLSDLHGRLHEAWDTLRGYHTRQDDPTAKPLTATAIAGKLKNNRVVFVGELHGNPGAHQVELEVLRAMSKQGTPLALATEQFERDTQMYVDDYLADLISEKEFRERARPWPNYADYRPLIEFCKANKIPVIAGNIPRPLANRVYKEGVEVLEKFSDDEKSWCAPEVKALPGAYRKKFFEAMGGMEGHSDAMERMYASQCFKDDTMADSVAKWLKDYPKGRVLHINGNFHSMNGLGVPEKLEALMPDLDIGLITCTSDPETEAAPNEWIVDVPAPRPMRRRDAQPEGH
ncbi:MAG: ChaN family lipoprotein [Planctomycetes bacterium]|nr:ChaN family lipoprotein [Planctomycetota bacterium]